MKKWNVDDFKVGEVVYVRIFKKNTKLVLYQGNCKIVRKNKQATTIFTESLTFDIGMWADPYEDEVRKLTELEKFLWNRES